METFVKNPNYVGELTQTPRPLTDEEIHNIIEKIPQPIGPTLEIQNVKLRQITSHLYDVLTDVIITPDLIVPFSDEILKQYNMSLVKAGKPFGMRIAESFIASVMQATLNTRHKAGSGEGTGFDDVREVLFLPVRRKTEEVYLHMNQRLTRRQIYDLRKSLVTIKISDLIVGTEIEEPKDLGEEWWHPVQRYANGINLNGDFKDVLVLRLYLDKSKMISYVVSIYDISAKILSEKPGLVKVVHGSFSDGIIDIYPLRRAFDENASGQGTREDTVYRLFLNQCLIPHFKTVRIRGISCNVSYLNLGETPVLSTILSSRLIDGVREEKILSRENHVSRKTPNKLGNLNQFKLDNNIGNDRKFWIIRKNRIPILFGGVSDEEIIVLLNAAGIIVYTYAEFKYFVFMPSGVSVSPDEHIKDVIEENDDILIHRYAILGSHDLRRIRLLPLADKKRTFSNNFHVMTNVLGVEIARAFHIYSSHKIMKGTGKTINSRYFEAFSNISMHRGAFSGITFTGIAKQTGGFFTQATIEQSGRVLSEGAVYNIGGESTRSVSLALSLGLTPYIGTGASGDYGVDFTAEDPNTVFNEMDGYGKDTPIDFDGLDEELDKLNIPPKEIQFVETQFDNNEGDGLDEASLLGRESNLVVPDYFPVRREKGVAGRCKKPNLNGKGLVPGTIQPPNVDKAALNAILGGFSGKIGGVVDHAKERKQEGTNTIVTPDMVGSLIKDIDIIGTEIPSDIERLVSEKINVYNENLQNKKVTPKFKLRPVKGEVNEEILPPQIPNLTVQKQEIGLIDTQEFIKYTAGRAEK